MARPRLWCLLAFGQAGLVLHPAGILAQEPAIVTGTVTGVNAAPLARARVGVTGTTITASTDSAGAFRMAGVPSGTQTIDVRMLGYVPLALAVDLIAGESFHVSLSLSREAVVLSPVEIKADTLVNPLLQGFRNRKARGVGTFFDRQDIAAMQPRLLTDVLRRVAGLQLQTAGENYGGGNTVQMGRNAGVRICAVEFYVNGSPFPLARDGGINHFIPPEEVMGIEVYNGASQIPPQFSSGMLNTRCGVIVIWTRSGPDARPAERRK